MAAGQPDVYWRLNQGELFIGRLLKVGEGYVEIVCRGPKSLRHRLIRPDQIVEVSYTEPAND